MKIKANIQSKAVLYPAAAAVVAASVLSGCQQQQQPTKPEYIQVLGGIKK